MPVDLSRIPEPATRNRPPSLKRWSMVLLIFLVLGGFLTSSLWPAQKVVREALFWHCFITAPLVIWAVFLGIRWLIYLAVEWPASGWDHERKQDIANEIRRGQRSLLLLGVGVQLPHVVESTTLSQQFLVPQGLALPAVVDKNTQAVSFLARFNDEGLIFFERVIERMNKLFSESAIQNSLQQRNVNRTLTIVVQIAYENILSKEELAYIQSFILHLFSTSRIHISSQFGLKDIDHWLDAPDSFADLLLVSVNLQPELSDGEGEAAVALLFQVAEDVSDNDSAVAYIHRPEIARDAAEISTPVSQALQWGKTQAEDIASVWLAGMGVESKVQSLLASSTLKFPRAEGDKHLVDIDMKSGHTGVTSPWLAVALAAKNMDIVPNPQLVMSISDKNASFYCLVIHPQVSASQKKL